MKVKNLHLVDKLQVDLESKREAEFLAAISAGNYNPRLGYYIRDAEDLQLVPDQRQLYEQALRLAARATRATNARDVRSDSVEVSASDKPLDGAKSATPAEQRNAAGG